jgi:hypothetical protein
MTEFFDSNNPQSTTPGNASIAKPQQPCYLNKLP